MSTLRYPKPDRGFLSVGRRQLMKIGAATGLTLTAAPITTEAAVPRRGAELFVFRAPEGGNVVSAVAFPVAAGAAPASTPVVRIHAGRQSWTLARASGTPGVVSLAGAARGFIGRSSRLTNGVAKPYHLVVLTVPPAAMGESALGVWAEIIGQGDDRLRVGNPIVSELLDQDRALARIFHRAHPTHDKALFAAALASRIAARASNNSALDPKAHGERLATVLLPDVLSFHPDAPVGFTFAGQNGRHPSDPVHDIVSTVLAGVVTPRASTDGPFRAAKAFPYFETTAA